MSKEESIKVKYSTYLSRDIVQAVKNFAVTKGISANQVVEAALKKCMPEKYYPKKNNMPEA